MTLPEDKNLLRVARRAEIQQAPEVWTGQFPRTGLNGEFADGAGYGPLNPGPGTDQPRPFGPGTETQAPSALPVAVKAHIRWERMH